jgi:hypothetical protein
MRRVARIAVVTLIAATAACQGDGNGSATPTGSEPATTVANDAASETVATTEAAPASPDVATTAGSGTAEQATTAAPDVAVDLGGADVVVRADGPGTPIDPRVFGTNVPAWLGPERLLDPEFQRLTVESGVTVVRMPGGSWSNAYDWRACEEGDGENCFWTWAAKPSDFAAFLGATGLEGMWTVSINESAQSAAAAVAFFNGEVGDTTVIGVDGEGFDWGTVDRWAGLRVERGFADPVGIAMWEVGNEVYGGKPGTGGDQCADFGWEDVWTCDGAEYVRGADGYDGYLATRDAMLAVDPTISVGAVGVADPSSWSDWGREVIGESGDALDFYVVHQYGFDQSPSASDALAQPAAMWPDVLDAARSELPGGVPVAITEYNLVSFEAGDTERTMTTAVNALYTADSLGQLVTAGVPIANHWNLANGTTSSGTDYGLISVDGGGTLPAYEAFRAWSAAGEELLAFDGTPPDDVRIYPTRRADGSLVIVAINLGDEPTSTSVRIGGADGELGGTVSTWTAERLDGSELAAAWAPVATADGAATLDLPAWTIAVWETRPDA